MLTVHYNDVIMGANTSQITSLTIVYSTVYSGAGQRKHQSSASPAFVRGIHRGPVNFPHKWPVTRKMFPLDDVIMLHFVLFCWGLVPVDITPYISNSGLPYWQTQKLCKDFTIPMGQPWIMRMNKSHWSSRDNNIITTNSTNIAYRMRPKISHRDKIWGMHW